MNRLLRLLCLLAFLSGCPESADSPQVLMEKGRILAERGQHRDAILVYRQGLAKAPEQWQLHYNLAISCGEIEDLDTALTEYSETIRLNPREPRALTNRGGIYAQRGQYAEAIEDLSEAIRYKPDDAIAYHNRGRAFLELGQPQQALLDFSAALKFDPDKSLTRYERGRAYARLGQLQAAIADFDRALTIDPQHIPGYVARGQAYRQLGELDRAASDFDAARGLDPQVVVPPATDSPATNAILPTALIMDALRAKGYTAITATENVGLFDFTARQGRRTQFVKVSAPDGHVRLRTAELKLLKSSPGILVRLHDNQVQEIIPDWNPAPKELVPTEFEWTKGE